MLKDIFAAPHSEFLDHTLKRESTLTRRNILAYINTNKTFLVLILFFSLFTFPTIFYGNKDARMLEVVSLDDPPITMQLEGMTAPPYGNPANYLKSENKDKIPKHWYNMNYFGIVYYGGFYLDIAFAIFAPLKWLGIADTFPTAPFILKFISVLSGLFSLTALYHFAKRYWGTFPAVFACIFLMTDRFFISFSSRIHPDILLCLLAFLGLFVASSYGYQRKKSTLIGLGIIVGLAQGTKVGAPWLLPMAFTAIGFANRSNFNFFFNRKYFLNIAKDSLILGFTAIVSFIISTPYAILDSYYFTSMKNALIANSGPSPIISNVNIMTWVASTQGYLGQTYSIIVIIVLLFSFFSIV